MRNISLTLFACCVVGCATEEPLDAVAETSTEDQSALANEVSEPVDGEFVDNEEASLTCSVKLVYCRDPRWVPHYPSFCSNGCDKDYAFAQARSLCRQYCGGINCSTMYPLGGC